MPATLKFRQALDSPAARYSQALLNEAYRRLGIDAQFIEVPFGRSLIESNRGILDGELARVLLVTEHYPNLVAVPYILFDTDVSIWVNQRRCPGCTLQTVKNLVYVRGSVIIQQLLADKASVDTVITVQTVSAAEQMFIEGKADAVVFAAYAIPADRLTGIPVSQKLLLSAPDYHLLHSRHEALIAPLATMLNTLEQEGVVSQLREQYGIPAPKAASSASTGLLMNY